VIPVPLLFAATLFVSAFLLFLIQPMIAQMILPRLGGTPAVWNTCMVFFQAALLAGYGYTHSATTYLPTRRQTIIQICLLALPFIFFLLPFGIGDWKPITDSNPIWSVLTILLLVVGLPFFVVATSAPLLQRWFASTGHPSSKDPYFLYGASNLGSMLALISYPFLFQPLFDLDGQALIWTGGYALMGVLVLACCAVVWKAAPAVELPRPVEVGAAATATVAPLSTARAEQHITKQPVRRVRGRVAVALKPVDKVKAPASIEPTLSLPQIALIAGGIVAGSVALYFVLQAIIKYYLQATTPGWLWVLCLNIGLIGLMILARTTLGAGSQVGEQISWLRRLRWIALAAVPSSLMLGVTTYMTTDIAAVPLFWIVPLSLYLLSFILVFARWPVPWTGTPHTYLLYAQPLLVLALGAAIFAHWGLPTWMLMTAHLLLFFVCVMVCHGELAKDRPSARYLTEFYLMMSIGGVLGGMFNSLLAPFLFQSGITEYGIAVAAAVYLRPQTHFLAWWRKKPIPEDDHSLQEYLLDLGYALCLGLLAFSVLKLSMSRAFWPGSHGLVEFLRARYQGIFDEKSAATWARWTELLISEGIPIAICLCFLDRPVRFGLAVACLMAANSLMLQAEPDIIYTHRSFFGVQRVRREKNEDNGQTYNVLIHGGIDHGRQNIDPEKRDQPISYFYPTNPIGQVYTAMISMDMRPPPPYGVIGLGIGTLASYGQAGQKVDFYEIDPAVLALSEPTDGSEPFFWYLHDAKQKRGVDLRVILGDGRLRMEEAPPNYYQIITVDAFSSDAIPVHLLTVEAIRLYLSKLRPDGIIIFNVTNRYVNLPPVLADAAKELDLVCLKQGDDYDRRIPDKFGSDWVILFRKQDRQPLAREMAVTVASMQPGMVPMPPGLTCSVIPEQAYKADLPSRLDATKWRAPQPTGRPAWRDQFQDLIRAITWTR
jgi:hypothetical protein